MFPDPLDGTGDSVIDVLDGVLQPLPGTLPGLTVSPLAANLDEHGASLRPLFESLDISGRERAFTALNTAFLEHGLVIHVAEGCRGGRILIRWAFTDSGAADLGNFRIVLLLGSGAELEVVEQFQSPETVDKALNVVTQAELGAGASLEMTRVLLESDNSALLTSTSVEQAADSRFTYSGFDLGGGLARHEIQTVLRGSGAHADIRGAFVLDGRRHVDNHVSVDHAAPGCSSEQFFRGVLGGRSRGVFNGKALIRAGADESAVHQSNANLLLSPLAEMDTKPELEIYADEVEASHGATVGQLDEAAVFYLRTRGLDEAQARRMLTAAFCHAVTDRLDNRELAGTLARLLDAAMPGQTPVDGEGETA